MIGTGCQEYQSAWKFTLIICVLCSLQKLVPSEIVSMNNKLKGHGFITCLFGSCNSLLYMAFVTIWKFVLAQFWLAICCVTLLTYTKLFFWLRVAECFTELFPKWPCGFQVECKPTCNYKTPFPHYFGSLSNQLSSKLVIVLSVTVSKSLVIIIFFFKLADVATCATIIQGVLIKRKPGQTCPFCWNLTGI